MSDGVQRVDVDAIRARYDRAYDMVGALCQPRGTDGAREWLMSIPARPNYDPDLVIAAALADVPALLEALAAAEAENARLREIVEKVAATEPRDPGIGYCLSCFAGPCDPHGPECLVTVARAALADAAPATREE